MEVRVISKGEPTKGAHWSQDSLLMAYSAPGTILGADQKG